MRETPNVMTLDVRVWKQEDGRYAALCPRWPWLKVCDSSAAEADAAYRRQVEELRMAVRRPF